MSRSGGAALTRFAESTLHGNTRVSEEGRGVMRESIPFLDEKQATDEQT